MQIDLKRKCASCGSEIDPAEFHFTVTDLDKDQKVIYIKHYCVFCYERYR